MYMYMARMLRCTEAKPVGLRIIAAMITDVAKKDPIKISSTRTLRSGQSERNTCVLSDGFLSKCFLCGKRLHDIDIYMYRGLAFCSVECRSKQISKEEHAEICKAKAFKSESHSLLLVPGIATIEKSCISGFKMQKQGFSGARSLGSFRSLVRSGSRSGAVRAGYTPNTKPSFESNSYENIAKIKLTAGNAIHICNYTSQQQLLQKISDLELDTNENQDKIRSVLEEKAKEIESFTSEVKKRDQKLEELESEMGQLKVSLDEEKQLHLASVESKKQLEEKILKIQASLTTTEAELTEAKRQYDMMLEVKQLELSKHLKDLCQKNDQAINEIRKNYESEKVEIVKLEKAKADKLLQELETKYEEKLTQNKADAQENLIRVREENITTISRLQQEFNEKELSIRTHHKEELHRLELHQENKLRDRLSALRKEHEIQMKSLKMQHEDDYRKLQEELELQKSKEEKQRALLQLQWKVMGDNQQGEQEVNSTEYSASSKRRELHGRRQSQRPLISPEAKRKDSNLPTILPSPITSIMRKERKMTHKEYEVEVGSGRSTKRKKTRNSAVFEETNATQKSAFKKSLKQSQVRLYKE
ncbi:synaptonemal complex protein 2-like protein [Carex littledalei]|uniref:Synaptonemal complex protein 2-like protein n=1 Tax=Carex littledalei TaxID=544730 RepID=A0A833QXJ0_9POAL|nr:synaptonemal complex protein 2-like protein [Carex littledalei]